tara:strand:+ start:1595 stop:2461 length:867 start_codon:yes stop_codon:yes gene_type:complete
MTFFNRKEEVLELKLTRIGRQKLSTGEFKPAYYEFLDEDVLYDRKNFATGSSEVQNEIKKRIKEKLTLRPLTAKQSVPGKGFVYKEENRLIESLGTFTPYSNYKPAWKILAEDGTIFTGSGAVSYSSLEANQGLTVGPSYEKIPQLNLVCEYTYNVGVVPNKEDASFKSILLENPNLSVEDLFGTEEDNTYMLFEKDFDDFTISFNEENVIKEKDEYVIEVFKYDYTTEGGQEKVTKTNLYFDNEQIDDESVYWYLNITTDDNVQKNNFTFVDEPVEILKVDDECVDL